MEIRVFAVGPLIHYSPLLTAMEKLHVKTDVGVKFFSTGSDEIAIKKVLETPLQDEAINFFITSISDLRYRLNSLLGRESDRDEFYQSYIIWRTLIDRIPISIIGNGKNGEHIYACYPEGSTVRWFVDTQLKKPIGHRIETVKFGQEKEFQLLSENKVNFAVTLEPWKIDADQYSEFNFQEVSGVPLKPFGFTSILSHISSVTDEKKKGFTKELIDLINIEIESIYTLFEDSQFLLNTQYVDKKRYIQQIQSSFSTYWHTDYENSKIEPALKWMAQHRIWAIDAVNPLSDKTDKLKSAYQKMDELSKKKSLEEFTLMSVHQLKNDLRKKVVQPISLLRRNSQIKDVDEELDKIESSTGKIISDYDNFLKAYNTLKSENEIIEYPNLYEIRQLIEDIQRVKEIDFLKVETTLADGIELKIANSILRYLLNGFIENAISNYKTKLSKEQKIIIRLMDSSIKKQCRMDIYNTGSRMQSRFLNTVGLKPFPYKKMGTGIFLIFANRVLEEVGASEIEQGRYLTAKNLSRPYAFQISMHLPIN